MDYYLNRFKSTVSTVADKVQGALPGNPIFREYEVHQNIATAGPGLSWKIYTGTKNTTKQAVSIWLFEKKQLERWSKQEREDFPELLKRGVSQLTRLRHPRLLVIERALEESRDTFAFCAEPVFASLANVFAQNDNLSSHLKDYSLLDVEIRHGLFQLSEALVFLHNDAKIVHGNICPSSVIINEKGAWKLAGFDFCVTGNMTSAGKVDFPIQEWDRRVVAVMNPELNFAAPELVQGIKCDGYADMFSLGVLAYSLFNNNTPVFDSKGLLDCYKKNIDKWKQLSVNQLVNVPEALKEDVKMCLNFTPNLRPDAIQFTKIAYFEDSLLKIFNCLDSLMQMDNAQKMQFFKNLQTILDKFPKRPLLQKVLPYLTAEFSTLELVPFILPNLFFIAEISTPAEFASIILPSLIPIFTVQRPYQTVLLLLQKIPLLLEKTPEVDIRKHVLPLVYTALTNENTKIQELCLNIIPTIGKLVDREAMRAQLLPKLLRLVLEENILAIRVQTLVCLGKLMPNLEPWMVSNQILPALPKINSKEPGILMASLGIYKIANETEKFGISTEQCAKSVLPFLISSCVENTLNLQQFEQFMALLHLLIKKVETEQTKRLQQLSASQEESRNMNNFNFASKEGSVNFAASIDSKTVADPMDADLKDLAGLFDSAILPDKTAPNKQSTLTLEDKKRLAAEQEGVLSNIKSPLTSSMLTKNNAQQPAKDLWASSFSLSIVQPVAGGVVAPPHNVTASSSPFTFPALNQQNINSATTYTNNLLNSNQPTNKVTSNASFQFANFPQPPSAAGCKPIQRSIHKSEDKAMDLDSLFGAGAPSLLAKPPSSSNPVLMKSSGAGTLDLSQFDKLINFPSSQKNARGQNPPATTNGFKDPFDGLLN